MSKRQIYLQQPDNTSRRIRRDLEFLRDYLDRLFTSDQNYDIRLPELLRANHLMRQLSHYSLPLNQGLRVNPSFTFLDNNDLLEPEDIRTEIYQVCNPPFYYAEPHNRRFLRLLSNNNTVRYNNLLENYLRQMSDNATERELIGARVLLSLIEQNRNVTYRNVFFNQRAAANNWNKPVIENRLPSVRFSCGLQEKRVHSRENNTHQVCPAYRSESCIANKTGSDIKKNDLINEQSAKQKENSSKKINDLLKMSVNQASSNQHYIQDSSQSSFTMLKKLQPHNNILQNSALNQNDPIRKQNLKESVETFQSVNKIINGADTLNSVESHIESDSAAISDKRSINSQPDCQENILQSGSAMVTDSSRYVKRQGYGNKRKLDDREDENAIDCDSSWNRTQKINEVKPQIKDMPMIFALRENASKAVRNRIRNGRLMEGRQPSRKFTSSAKYANFLRMCRKEEIDERSGNNSTSQKDEVGNFQPERGIPMGSVGYGNQMFHASPQIEKRNRPTPRTVHTTYNPMMHSPISDSILNTCGLTAQLLRLAVLLYAPALMPALNSLIAQQNHQIPLVPCFEGSYDLLKHVFRLLSEQKSIPNLPFASIAQNVSSPLTVETSTGNSSTRHIEEENITIASEGQSSSKQKSVSNRSNSWRSHKFLPKNEKNKNWRLTSMLGSDMRLEKNIFKTENFRSFGQFMKAEKNQGNIQSLSTRNKSEIVMKEYFRDWLHRLLQQLDVQNTENSHLSSDDKEPKYSGEISKIDNSKEIKDQQNSNNLLLNSFLNFSKNDGNTEHEKDDSADQKSFTSTSNSYSSKLILSKQNEPYDASDEHQEDKNAK